MLNKAKVKVIIIITLMIVFPFTAFAQNDQKTINEEWKEIQAKYPKFAVMYITNSALLFELRDSIVQSSRNQELRKLLNNVVARNCELRIYPKCSQPRECRDCEKELGEFEYGVNHEEWGRCILEVVRCNQAPRLCCE